MSREGCCAGRRIRARGIISELHAARLLSARTGPPFERTRLCQRDRLCLRAHACARGSGSGARQCRPALCGRGARSRPRRPLAGLSRRPRRRPERRRASLRWGWLPSECDAAKVALHTELICQGGTGGRGPAHAKYGFHDHVRFTRLFVYGFRVELKPYEYFKNIALLSTALLAEMALTLEPLSCLLDLEIKSRRCACVVWFCDALRSGIMHKG